MTHALVVAEKNTRDVVDVIKAQMAREGNSMSFLIDNCK